MRKVSTLFGIIIIVVAIIILFGGVFAWQYYALKSQQSSNFFVSSQKTNQAQTQTAGWKTYKNNDYRFEISYPGKWFEIENPNLYFMQSTDESLFSPFSFDELKKNFDEENQEDWINPGFDEMCSTIWVTERNPMEQLNEPESIQNCSQEEKIVVNGTNGCAWIADKMDSGKYYGVDFATPDSKKIITIETCDIDSSVALLDQMLSTFKFTK